MNPFFNQFDHKGEQSLFEDMAVESIRIGGHEVVYMPREIVKNDLLLNEPEVTRFKYAIDVDVYINNWGSFEGDGQLLSKFGLEIRDQMTLTMSHRTFQECIAKQTFTSTPNEGDCIFIPMTKNVYQIKWVNDAATFYAFGKLNTWEIVCELLEYSGEIFETGRADIDNLNPVWPNFNDPDYDLESYDRTAKNQVIQEESDEVLDFSEMNPFILGDE